MKKVLSLVLALTLMLALAACGGGADSSEPAPAPESAASEAPVSEPEPEPEEPAVETELIVFAAASMTETLEAIAELYKQAAPGVALVYNFDSSGTLKTQIEEGADCDVFISAGQKQMNELDITADAEVNVDGLDFVQEGTRVDILENKVTLCVPAENPKELASFDNWAEKMESDADILMAMGNSDVPVGQYTQKILGFYGLDEAALANAGKITYGTNVKEVTTQITEASVDCGVVYCTDAFSAGLEIIDYATAEMCGQVIYPAAVLNISQNTEAAEAFLAFLATPEAVAVFEEVGFSAI